MRRTRESDSGVQKPIVAGRCGRQTAAYSPREYRKDTNMAREASITRKTKETDIRMTLSIDGQGRAEVHTGIGFFDHMLEGFAKHGFFDLSVSIDGDLQVDGHHTVEDCGIVLGQAIAEATGDKKGIRRYGYFLLPMDDALVACAVDLCGRPWFNYAFDFPTPMIGGLDTQLIREFFYAVSYSSGMNLHIKVLDGINSHHIAEAMFKAFAKALDMATGYDGRINGVLSTKGSL